MKRKFEDLLEVIGSFGRYQKKLILLVLIPNSLFVAFMVNLTYFQAIVPEYWCHVPGREKTPFSIEEWKNITIPKDVDGAYERCVKYKLEWDRSTQKQYWIQNQTEGCVYGWNHDESIFTETIATDNEWLCRKEIYSTHILSVYMAGNAVGTLILPFIVDKITGRRLMYFITCASHAFFTLLLLLVPTFKLHLGFRFLAGLAFHVNFQMPLIITLELITARKRALAGTVAFLTWTIAMCFTSFIAYLVPHWWYLALISCIPSILSFSFWKILPESPRWLLCKGKYYACATLLRKVAEENGRNVSAEFLESDLRSLSEHEPNFEFRDYFKHPRLFRNALILFCSAFSIWTSYGCITLNMNILPNNYFLNYFILSLMEFPSNISSYIAMNYFGRKLSIMVTFLLTAIIALVAIFNLKHRGALLLLVSLMKILVTQSLLIVYVVVGEIFPTPIRAIGFGVVLVAACFGMMISPYVINEGEVFQYLTVLTLSLIVMMMFLQMPETLGESMPQTFLEAENLGKGQPFLIWPNHWNRKRSKDFEVSEESVSCKLTDEKHEEGVQ